jgi:hypothetical protein
MEDGGWRMEGGGWRIEDGGPIFHFPFSIFDLSFPEELTDLRLDVK